MYIPQDSPLVLHLPTSWRPARSQSLPHMHVQRWDLAQIRTCNRMNRRRTRYHCASNPAGENEVLNQDGKVVVNMNTDLFQTGQQKANIHQGSALRCISQISDHSLAYVSS